MFLSIPQLYTMSKQEIFDTSARHVLKNRRPSMRGGICCYDGIGCAAAPFLKPESRHQADTEESTWDQLAVLGYVDQHELELIRELQKCHDDAALEKRLDFMAGWKESMLALGQHLNLNTDVLTTEV